MSPRKTTPLPRAGAVWPALGLLIGCALVARPAGGQSPAPTALDAASLPALRVVDPTHVDTAAKACTDFFQFANGAWLRRDTIPADYAESGVSKEMTDRNEIVVRSVLIDAVARRDSASATPTVRKLGTYYAACMDSARADADGARPIAPLLDSVAAVRTRAQLVHTIAALQPSLQTTGLGAGFSSLLFRFVPESDPHDAARYMAWVRQGGLGMPDRDYYTKPGRAADSLRRHYVEHVTRMLRLSGEGEAMAAADAGRIMDLETAMARASLTRVAQREPRATDHPMSVTRLGALAPAIDWPAYFREVGVTVPVTRLNVAEPAFFSRIGALLTTAPLASWRAYLRYHVLASASPWLSAPFVQEDFAYRSRFTGATAMLPRWKRCLHEADGDLGEALGEAYVAKNFSPEARTRARAVIDDVRDAFGARLATLAWMSDSTKQRALAKLHQMREQVGYPDHWRDYTRLDVVDGPFVSNLFAARTFEWHRVANRPGAPLDSTEWDITVPTVNAYYDASRNEMVFPAGALVPQTFDANADDGANYGSLAGSWAGHELTHGFDDEGRHYDAAGNLRDWWTAADAARFVAQADRVVRQFDAYLQVDTLHVNGRLTLGENIADYGGLLTGYDALERALERRGRPGLIDGFTPEQRFFVSYAQSFRGHTRDAELRTRVLTDPHSPERWRVNGPLSNMPGFAHAFACKPGDPMVRAPKVVPDIW
jgi:putative endopeptidase